MIVTVWFKCFQEGGALVGIPCRMRELGWFSK
jgi:hypothetical protein